MTDCVAKNRTGHVALGLGHVPVSMHAAWNQSGPGLSSVQRPFFIWDQVHVAQSLMHTNAQAISERRGQEGKSRLGQISIKFDRAIGARALQVIRYRKAAKRRVRKAKRIDSIERPLRKQDWISSVKVLVMLLTVTGANSASPDPQIVTFPPRC